MQHLWLILALKVKVLIFVLNSQVSGCAKFEEREPTDVESEMNLLKIAIHPVNFWHHGDSWVSSFW
jgi:hypothetical protein